MYYLTKITCAEDAEWVKQIRSDYYNKVVSEIDADPGFVESIKNPKNIQIVKKPRYVIEASYDITLTIRMELSCTSAVSDGYDVEIEDGLFGSTYVNTKERSHYVTTSNSDTVDYEVTKTVSTDESGFDSRYPLYRMGNGKEHKKYYAAIDSATGERLMRMSTGFGAAQADQYIRQALKSKDLYADDILAPKRKAYDVIRGTRHRLSDFRVINAIVTHRNKFDVYIDYDYEIKVVYGGKTYKTDISEPCWETNAAYAVSSLHKMMHEYRLDKVKKHRIINSVTTSIAGAAALAVFVCACVFGGGFVGVSSFSSLAGMPLSLLALLFIAADVAAMVFYAKIADNILRLKDPEKPSVRIAMRIAVRQERERMCLCIASWTLCIVFGILQAIALLILHF